MGHSYILWLHADAVDELKPSSDNWADACAGLGEAVLRLTSDIRYYAGGGPQRRTKHGFGSSSDAVSYCDEAHSSDQLVYVWSGNRLCPLSSASHDEVEFAERRVAQELKSRAKAKA